MIQLFWSLLLSATTLVTVICSIAFWYLKKEYRYWEKLGIPGPKPALLLGNYTDIFKARKTEAELLDGFYKEYSGEKYVGIYNLWKPSLVVLDSDLLKQVTETDFECFTDRPAITGEAESDSIFDSIFTMNGQIWQTRRKVLTRLFTPKMLRQYREQDWEVSNKSLITSLKEMSQEGKDVDTKDLFELLMIKSIAKVMYGLDLSLDCDTINMFRDAGGVFSVPPTDTVLKFVFYPVFPRLFNLLRLRTYPVSAWDHFQKLTNELIAARVASNSQAEDLLGIVHKMYLEGHKEFGKIPFTEVVGHLYTFFVAGYHTTELTMSHVLLKLATFPEVQDKVRKEIVGILDGATHVTYDHLKSMKYLECVLNETQRMHPLLGVLKRTCTKPFKVDDKLTIPVGMDVQLPVLSFQNDSKYFVDPTEFKPERFMSQASSVFMPFGKGPRLCIGMRYADVQMRLTISTIISQFSVHLGDQMKLPLTFSPKTVIITNRPQDGIWLKFEALSKQM